MEKNSSFKKLTSFAGKYRFLTYTSWLLSVVSAMMALVPFIYIWLIIKEVLDVRSNFENATNISFYGWLAVIFAVSAMLIYLAALLCSHLAAFRVQANIRSKMMHHIVTLPMGFMDNVGTGKLRKTVDECSAATETYLAHQMPDTAVSYATPVGLLILLFVFDWRLGLLSLIPIVLSFGIMISMTGKKMVAKMKEYQNSLDTMSNEAVEYVRGIPVVKTFGQSVFSFKHFKESIDNYRKWVISYTKDLRMPMVLYTTIINAVFAVLIAAALVITSNGITDEFILNILFYIIITPIISVTLTKMMYSSENKMVVNDSLKRIDSVLQLKPLEETKNPSLPKDNSIVISNVVFKYQNQDNNALNNISLSIKSGEHIALVGASGSGKTTLASLIARFWDPQSGEIKIGDVNVKEIRKKDLMNIVSFVFQDSRLIKKSIYDNVRISKPDATRQEVLEALHEAQCDDILAKLPDGIDTVIGSKGTYLSGGEQQRITIARVMLKNSPIIILDEATAFADPDNEIMVQKAFSNLAKGKTVIMIAHRLSTITNCDCIYVLSNGTLAESGTHNELTKQSKIYFNMWNEYIKAASWKVGNIND